MSRQPHREVNFRLGRGRYRAKRGDLKAACDVLGLSDGQRREIERAIAKKGAPAPAEPVQSSSQDEIDKPSMPR